jgi:uncharacterized protein with PIN domain
MTDPPGTPQGPDVADLVCADCNRPLEMGKVEASYLGQRFTVELPRCPSCGFVYVSEELALGRMQKVEQALEDK